MSNFGSIFEAQKRSVVKGRAERGVTFIELLVVLAIVSLLSTLLISGYHKMESGFRASTALSRVESALHYARNLAIANNAVYHVRFENVNTDGTPIMRSDMTPGVDHVQSLGIYCFPDMGTAFSVTDQYAIDNAATPIKWNPSNSLILNGVPHNNYLIERIALPENTFYGVQYLSPMSPAQHPNASVIYFKPDGTQCFTVDVNGTGTQTSLTLFVTDGSQYADNRTLDAATFTALQDNRRSFFNTRKTAGMPSGNNQTPWMKMIQVFHGGMIRVLPAGSQL